MARRKPKEFERRESVPISLPSHMARTLSILPNKSETITTLLTENMDRITNGDLNLSAANRKLLVNRMVVEAISQSIEEFELTLNQCGLSEIKNKIDSMHSKINSEEIVSKICDAITSKSEQIVEDMKSIETW